MPGLLTWTSVRSGLPISTTHEERLTFQHESQGEQRTTNKVQYVNLVRDLGFVIVLLFYLETAGRKKRDKTIVRQT